MTISGPDALRSIEEALRDIRREEDDVVRRLARSTELGVKLKAQQVEIIGQLAALRLDAAARATLSSELAGAEDASGRMLDAHQEKLTAAETEVAELDAQIGKSATDRSDIRNEQAKREAELRALAAKARPKLGTDPGYAQKLVDAREFAALAEQALRKSAQAEADREYNGRAYRDDPLFMYLQQRGYGTKNYRANALSAWLDRKVAALIGYDTARSNFAMLNDIPLRWREHAERMQEKARAAAAEIAALENVAVDSAGGRSAREALETLGGRVDGLDAEIVALQDRRDEALRVQRELAQGNAGGFVEALGRLDAALGEMTVRALVNDARAAPRGQDITLVQQLDDLTHREKDEADEAQEHRARLKILAARRRDLEDIQFEIKAQGFDSPQSSVANDELTGEALNELLRGELSASAYWGLFRASQGWITPQAHGAPGRANGFSRPRAGVTAQKPAERLTSAA